MREGWSFNVCQRVQRPRGQKGQAVEGGPASLQAVVVRFEKLSANECVDSISDVLEAICPEFHRQNELRFTYLGLGQGQMVGHIQHHRKRPSFNVSHRVLALPNTLVKREALDAGACEAGRDVLVLQDAPTRASGGRRVFA